MLGYTGKGQQYVSYAKDTLRDQLDPVHPALLTVHLYACQISILCEEESTLHENLSFLIEQEARLQELAALSPLHYRLLSTLYLRVVRFSLCTHGR